jgi:hypothetical protein
MSTRPLKQHRAILSRVVCIPLALLLLYLCLYYSLIAAAGRLGLAGVLGVHVDLMVWLVRVFSAVGACLGTVVLWIWIRHWPTFACVLFVVLAPIVLFFLFATQEAWTVFGCKDSDEELVPTGLINRYLFDGVNLPASADDIHAFIAGGINPTLYLRFRAKPEEAQDFFDRTLATARKMMSSGGLRSREIGQRPSEFGGAKTWWTPREDLPWWFYRRGEPGNYCFLQLVEEESTVYLVIAQQ